MDRRPGLSVRLKLTLSYAGLLMLAGFMVLAVVWVLLLRYGPEGAVTTPEGIDPGRMMVNGDLLTALRLMVGVMLPTASIVMAFLLVFGLLGGWVLAGRMLAPLDQITRAVRQTTDASLSRRIRLPGRKDEFRELADAFDGMLEQLEAHVTEQQRFAANASHELRTPLAISQTLIEVARAGPADQDELIDRLHTVNTRAIDLTEGLLLLNRSDRRLFTTEPVDLSLLAEEAAETLLPLAEERKVALDVTGEPARTVGSAALLLRMVTNLVQNAIVHNLPEHGTVTVNTAAHDDGVVVRVENTGPPVPSALLPTLLEPFQRGTDRARTETYAGVGLGLAIVNSIVRAHDGTLDLIARPAGGLIVTIRLPPA
ncbi:sensor histidine kinase [Microlunatus parietis]|uniref:histidine kinase n=1 Tax=Microlunatus parietis TaxID=682979 RepID=A0A7Y9ICL4_9ACTN|nr:HAMP domain-containing sensor histidine kinase [Microlunatus parietis]NYE74334.1 two-component system sensor histidine kinase VanS [Microlunatus parietis]